MDLISRSSFRASFIIGLLCFIIFQGIIINTNSNYGTKSNITVDYMDLVVSPYQPDFGYRTSIPAHTFDDNYYYSLNYLNDSNSNPDLLTIRFTEDFKEIEETRLIIDLNISSALSYNGLYYSNNHLWTIGSYEENLNSSLSTLYRVLIQLDLNGIETERITLPPIIMTENIGIGETFNQFVYANITTVAWVSTPNYYESTLTFFDLQLREFSYIELFLPYHQKVSHVESNKLWLHYKNDPYDAEESYLSDESISNSEEEDGLYALSFDDPVGSFDQTILFEKLSSSSTQILPSTLSIDEITQPILNSSENEFIVSENMVIRPVKVYDNSNPEINVFYGFEFYQLRSAFFNALNVSFLTLYIIAFSTSAIIKYKLRDEKSGSISQNQLLKN